MDEKTLDRIFRIGIAKMRLLKKADSPNDRYMRAFSELHKKQIRLRSMPPSG